MNTFNREGNGINDWTRANEDLVKNLEVIRNGGCRKEEMEIFLLKAVRDADVSESRDTVFWAYDDPASMPADARCEFVYRPTYLMTLAMVGIVNRYPELMNLCGVEELLCYSLNACAGRDLQGHGYDAYEELCDNVLLFLENGIVKFMKDWPLFSVRFEEVFRNALNRIERDYRAGKHGEGWGSDRKEVQEKIVRLRNDAAQA